MKIRNEEMKISALSLAVQGALIAMFAMPMTVYAADSLEDEVAVIRHPTNFVEIGAENVSKDSARFGAYNGLDKSGGQLIGNFSVRGGDAYEGGTGTKRWELTGSDLGTSSRSLGGAVSDQGKWKLGVGYDELTHNLSNTYQTPYQGSMGGNSFVLPAGFGTVSTVAAGTTPVGTVALSPSQLAAFHTVDISSTRKNGSVNAGVNLNAEWGIKFDFNHMVQSGAKLMGFASNGAGGATVPQGEAISMLPSPTNYKTDTINLALNWAGEKGHLTTSYFGSFFKEGYDRTTFQTYAVNNATAATNGVTAIDTQSTMPSNNFNQLNVSGGYILAPKTKLTGGVSYARNTQNEAFVVDPTLMVTASPQASLNGLVKTTHADLKLIDQTTKELALSAGVKYDQRSNNTASNFYNFNSVDGGNPGKFASTPLSIKKTQLELAGDYRLDKDQHLRLAFNRENVKRWCGQYAASTGIAAGVSGYYPAGTSCVVATDSKDDQLSALYKLRASEEVNLSLGYGYSKRTTDSDPNAITARKGTNGNVNLAATGLIWGLNAGDFRGFYPVFDASRKQQMLKAGVNWQANEKLSVGLMGRLTDDKYDSTYGVTKGNSWNLNLDATYGYSDDGSISTYLTQQQRQRDMTDLQKSLTTLATTGNGTTTGNNGASNTAIGVPPGATWTDKLKNDDTTIGIGVKQSGLMHSKLELTGDLTYTLGKSAYGTQLNYATTTSVNGGLKTCSDPAILSCGDLPVIQNKTLQLKLTGQYHLDKSSMVAVGYLFQQLKSTDYYYNGLQYSTSPNALMPTNQQPGSYAINVISASYIYNFK